MMIGGRWSKADLPNQVRRSFGALRGASGCEGHFGGENTVVTERPSRLAKGVAWKKRRRELKDW